LRIDWMNGWTRRIEWLDDACRAAPGGVPGNVRGQFFPCRGAVVFHRKHRLRDGTGGRRVQRGSGFLREYLRDPAIRRRGG